LRGNRYHVYASFSTKNKSCSNLQKVVYYDLNYMFTEKCKVTYPKLLGIGFVSCYKEFYHVEYFLGVYARYECYIVIERCFQRVRTGILAYRIPDRPICYEDYFIIKENMYSKDANKILLEFQYKTSRVINV